MSGQGKNSTAKINADIDSVEIGGGSDSTLMNWPFIGGGGSSDSTLMNWLFIGGGEGGGGSDSTLISWPFIGGGGGR